MFQVFIFIFCFRTFSLLACLFKKYQVYFVNMLMTLSLSPMSPTLILLMFCFSLNSLMVVCLSLKIFCILNYIYMYMHILMCMYIYVYEHILTCGYIFFQQNTFLLLLSASLSSPLSQPFFRMSSCSGSSTQCLPVQVNASQFFIIWLPGQSIKVFLKHWSILL